MAGWLAGMLVANPAFVTLATGQSGLRHQWLSSLLH